MTTAPSPPALPSAPETVTTYGWVIESGPTDAPLYWTGDDRPTGTGFSRDHTLAVRFVRARDAWQVACRSAALIPASARVAEHGWDEGRRPAPQSDADVERIAGETDEAWIARVFFGHGRAIRKETDPPFPGEPYMSIEDAKAIVRTVIAERDERAEYASVVTAKLKKQLHEIGPAIIARAEAAESQVERLTKALEEIRDRERRTYGIDWATASAALSPTDPETAR